MKKTTLSAYLYAVIGLLSVGAVAAQAPPADLILTHGKIYANNTDWVEAVAMSHGTIVAVGDAKTIESYQTSTTKVIDLKGDTVLPGLHDMHLHPMGGGQQYSECRLKRGATPAEIRVSVKECATKAKPGEWITGGKWVNSTFTHEVQDKKLLDQVAPNNPVVLTEETGHSSWANSMALKMAGITRDTPNPLNGVIEHRPDGEPNGLLREQAAGLVRAKIPPPSEAQKAQWLKIALQEMLSYGITTFQDAGAGGSLVAYDTLYDSGWMKQHARACINWSYQIGGNAQADALITRRNLYARPLVATNCVKIVLDGVPGEGHTAAMIDPYEPIPGDKDESRKYGIMTVPPDVLKQVVTKYDAQGLWFVIHATGDASAHAALDALAEARKVNGWNGRPLQISHSDFLTPEDIKRARQLGATFEFSAYLYYPNPVVEVYEKAIGMERFKRFKPLREVEDAGDLIDMGSDWTVSPSVSPWVAIETLVTRKKPGDTGDALALNEAITMKEAIDIFTINGARQMGDADRVGLIKPGYLADMIIVDRNPFTAPIGTVHDTKVKTDIINGEIVYTAPSQVAQR